MSTSTRSSSARRPTRTEIDRCRKKRQGRAVEMAYHRGRCRPFRRFCVCFLPFLATWTDRSRSNGSPIGRGGRGYIFIARFVASFAKRRSSMSCACGSRMPPRDLPLATSRSFAWRWPRGLPITRSSRARFADGLVARRARIVPRSNLSRPRHVGAIAS